MEHNFQLSTTTTTTASNKYIPNVHSLGNMNAEFSVALKHEPLSPSAQPPPTTQRKTSSLANFKDMENIYRILNNRPTTTTMIKEPQVSYYDQTSYTVMKNSISSSISTSSSFDDGDGLPFCPPENFNKPQVSYEPSNYAIVKNSIGSSMSSSSSFDDGDESPFCPSKSFDYDTDDYNVIDDDNDSLCDEVINELISDAGLQIFGMLFPRGRTLRVYSCRLKNNGEFITSLI